MRATFDSIPSRRPMPRQLDIGDWSSTSTTASTTSSFRGSLDNYSSGSSVVPRRDASTSALHSSYQGGAQRDSTSPRSSVTTYSTRCSERDDSYPRARGFDSRRNGLEQPVTTSERLPGEAVRRDEWATTNRKHDAYSSIEIEGTERRGIAGSLHRQHFSSDTARQPTLYGASDNQIEFRDWQRSSVPEDSKSTFENSWSRADAASDSRRKGLQILQAGDETFSSSRPHHTSYDKERQPRTLLNSFGADEDESVGINRYSNAGSLGSGEGDRGRSRGSLPSPSISSASALPRLNKVSFSEASSSPTRELSNQSDNDAADSSMTSELGLSTHEERRPRSDPPRRGPSRCAPESRALGGKTSSEQRAELYAFRKDMREAFSRVDEMVDGHRDLFRSDPTSGVPVFNATAHDEAERLAVQVFEQLASLRERFRRLAVDFQEETRPIASADGNEARFAGHSGHRTTVKDAELIRTMEVDGKSEITNESSSVVEDEAGVAGQRGFARDEDDSASVSSNTSATTLGKTQDDSCSSRSRRLSLSLESDGNSSDVPLSARGCSFSESVRSSETSPPRSSAVDSDAGSPVFPIEMQGGIRGDRTPGVDDDGGSSIFKGTRCWNDALHSSQVVTVLVLAADFDRRMEEIRSSLSAIAQGRQEAPRVRPAASSIASSASAADRQRQLRRLLTELQSSE